MINYPHLTKVLDRKHDIALVKEERDLWLRADYNIFPKYQKSPKIKMSALVKHILKQLLV